MFFLHILQILFVSSVSIQCFFFFNYILYATSENSHKKYVDGNIASYYKLLMKQHFITFHCIGVVTSYLIGWNIVQDDVQVFVNYLMNICCWCQGHAVVLAVEDKN